jgi:hypothetical protein
MRLEILSLCDFARAELTGKLYIIGAFDTINSQTEPIVYGLFSIATRIRFEQIEEGARTISFSFVDPDGRKVMPGLQAQMQIQIVPPQSTALLNLALVVPQINLPRFGEYAIDLAVDSHQLGSIPLYVRRQPIPGPTPS